MKTLKKSFHFLKQTRIEMKKVKWLTMKELRNQSLIVLFIVIAFGVYFFVVDAGILSIKDFLTK